MKKTYNINLSGMVFTMDDDAYDLLNDYLDTLQHAFRHDEDAKEITGDIESRAAELLTERLGDTRVVVTLNDIENVIARIGRPEEMMEEEVMISSSDTSTDTDEIHNQADSFSAEDYNHSGEADANQFNKQQNSQYSRNTDQIEKKLYRDPQNAMIGGVCAGLAAYFHVDVTWVRLFTVAISFLSFSTAAIVYLILWIVLPEAKTPYERMQMKGEVPTVENIGRNVTSNFHEEQGVIPPPIPDTRSSFMRFLDNLVKILGVVAKALLVFVAVIAAPVVGALLLAVVALIFAMIIFSTSWGLALWNDYPGELLGVDLGVSPILQLLMVTGYIVCIAIPLGALAWTVLFRNRPITKGWKRTLGIIWIIGFLLSAILTAVVSTQDEINRWKDGKEKVMIEKTEDPVVKISKDGDTTEISVRGVTILKEDGITNEDNNYEIDEIDEIDLDRGKLKKELPSRINDRNK